MNTLLGLVVGLLSGAILIELYRSKEVKRYKEIIAAKDELLVTYDEYVALIEVDSIKGYREALDETLMENIKLRKLINSDFSNVSGTVSMTYKDEKKD